jgi:hypothetical protein
VIQKGAKAGQTKGEIRPLFVLKKEVTIPARIFTEDLKEWWLPKIKAGMRLAYEKARR